MMITGAQAVAACLKEQGVDVVFGYPGGMILPLYDAFYDEKGIREILVTHEQNAAHAADGYARASGKVGVCIATSGPGATNLVTGLATAFMDSIPVVAITGQVDTSLLGRDAFQETDILDITMPITKNNYKIKDVKKLREMKTEKLVELTAEQMGIPANLINYQNDTTIGELIDAIAEDPEVQANRDESYTFNSTVGEVVEMFGTEKVRNILLYETRDARLNHEYDNTKENILSYWLQLLGFTLLFAGLATVTLEFIDKDKR